jgi:hypothetical protein
MFATEPSFSNNPCVVDIHKTYRYYCNEDGYSFPLHQTGDGERYLKENCPV